MSFSTSPSNAEGAPSPTFSFFDLEIAICDARGDWCLLDLAVEDALRQDASNLAPDLVANGRKLLLLTKEQVDTLLHAVNRVGRSVADVSHQFYLPDPTRRAA